MPKITERPDDCPVLDAMCKDVEKLRDVDEFLRATNEHQRTCPICAELARKDAMEEPEPPCQCRTTGDLFDPRGCELHDSTSAWNGRQNRLRLEVLEGNGAV